MGERKPFQDGFGFAIDGRRSWQAEITRHDCSQNKQSVAIALRENDQRAMAGREWLIAGREISPGLL